MDTSINKQSMNTYKTIEKTKTKSTTPTTNICGLIPNCVNVDIK